MKIFSTNQVRKADIYTIAHEPIASIDLMERAAESCFNWLIENTDYKNKQYIIFCGTGNNGGDGLAVARMLTEKKAKVCTFILDYGSGKSKDFALNEGRLKNTQKSKILYLTPESSLPKLNADDIIVDAIFGSGLNKPVTGFPAEVINHINACSCFTISVDIPSGLFGDDNRGNNGAIVKADVTLSLQFPKMSFFFPDSGPYAGQWVIVPIGLHPDFISREETSVYFTLKEDVKPLLKKRNKFAHKGHFGHALLIAGAKGKAGAAVLAARACLRTGVGLLTTHLPACMADIMQTAVPEAMVNADFCVEHIKECPTLVTYAAVAAGPGLGKHDDTKNALEILLRQCLNPLILDADALNIISENPEFKNHLPAHSIITPHVKEFERFAGRHFGNSFERFEHQKALSVKHKIYIVLKGAYTCITTPEGTAHFNATGNPGMATGGSGDVLTGILLGLLAQGYSSFECAVTGVYIHGLAGDLAAADLTEHAIIATDIINYIPMAYKYLLS
ncbi:MAG: Bifunctional NAD(P)H-hydrate repair enzyme Nnr [Bacteroidetes bacterium ADurb.Bin408]|nr:MAG: Bifunctional NAD(P)H-hydrate repair enzyme Nnr [Bacteroidetes bacterium ADurb.Bin408]